MGAQLLDWALHLAVPLKTPSGREGGVLRRAGRKRWVPSERQEAAREGTRHRGAGGATRKGSGEQGRALSITLSQSRARSAALCALQPREGVVLL